MDGIRWQVDPSGDLVISCADVDYVGADLDSPRELAEALGLLTTHDGYDWVRPEEVGALTDAPLLGYGVERSATGELISLEHLYWYPAYEIRDPVAELLAGCLIFRRAPNADR